MSSEDFSATPWGSRVQGAADDWYVANAGEIVGPVPAAQVAAWLQAGMTDAHVRFGATADWIPIRDSEFARSGATALAATEPSATAVAAPEPSAAPRGSARGGLGAFFVSCLHVVRWSFAAFLATSLSFAIVTVACLKAPMSVIDSPDFWMTWASRSPMLTQAHAEIDDWFARNRHSVRIPFADQAAVNESMESMRTLLHDGISGEVIDGIVGVVTGRDEALRLDAKLASLKEKAKQRFAQSLQARRCSQADGVCAGKAALEAGAYQTMWSSASAMLDSLTVGSFGRIADALPFLATSRFTFTMIRLFLGVAPFVLAFVGLGVLISSLRLRTAAFMFGCCFVFAGASLIGAARGAEWVAAECGFSGELWTLAVQHSGAADGFLGADSLLLGAGAILLFARLFGPSWREKFWRRRLASTAPEVAEIARARLSRPAGLLEPWHVIRAPKS